MDPARPRRGRAGRVAAIALGLDTGVLTNLSLASTNSLEQSLLDKLHPRQNAAALTAGQAANHRTPQMRTCRSEGPMPPLDGATAWLNSPPLTTESLKGKVVVVDFWTYSCINCLRSIPYVRAWAEKYRDHGLVVIGVHAPEFAFERDVDNVRKAISTLKIDYPVAVDNDYKIWQRVRERILAGALFHRCQGQYPPPPFRRGRLRGVRTGDPGAARRSRPA